MNDAPKDQQAQATERLRRDINTWLLLFVIVGVVVGTVVVFGA